MSGIEKDLRPKGFEVVEAAVNANPDVPGFIRKFNPPFPVGTAGGQEALDYLQWPKDQRPLVPLMMFIDRKGIVRAQYSGLDEKFFDAQQDQHIREEAAKLLAEGAAPVKARSKRPAK
ncbi:MAG TPA: hypothetical protein VEV17_12745 [Bryobacteraceae bacterium]|nr:hypothetical protein [Bryobacteraceae bacterium]